MKKWASLLAVLLLFVPAMAQAGFPPDNEESWNKTVKYRTTRSTTLYSHHYTQDSWYSQEEEEAISVFTPIGTLPAGKWVNVLSDELCGKREVFYWDGGRRSAWIDEDAYTRDTVQITSASGQKTSIPRKAYGDAAAVRYVLGEFLSDAEVESYIKGMQQQNASDNSEGGSGSSTDSGSSGSTAKARKGKSLALPVITLDMTGDDGTAASAEVELVQPGLLTSIVEIGGEMQSVPTRRLSWERGDAEHALAIIYAPRGGTATLWQKSTGKEAICKLKAGSVVLVLEKGGKFTRVLGEGKAGYVLTSALNMADPAEEGTKHTASRKLTLRLEAGSKGRSLASIPKGESVTVLGEDGKWAMLEYEGLVGFVEKSCLTD